VAKRRTPVVTPSPWLTVPELAARLRVSEDKVRKDLKHRIPHRQDQEGGPMYFHVRDVESFEASVTVHPVG
jgi:hypothetical protein